MSDFRLSFEQREGAADLPTQLQPRVLSRELRAVLWATVYDSISVYGGEVRSPWLGILQANHVMRQHRMIDSFKNYWEGAIRPELSALFDAGSYTDVLGFLEFVLRHPDAPAGFSEGIAAALEYGRAAYRVVDDDTIAQIGSEEEARALAEAFEAADHAGLAGARAHLKESAVLITGGAWADSVRESIHAVESVAVVLSPGSNTLAPALKALAAKAAVHEALKGGFSQIYGFTSDESGIRHALIEKGDANVDEADAMFMLGACAAFVSYLIAKARSAGLI